MLVGSNPLEVLSKSEEFRFDADEWSIANLQDTKKNDLQETFIQKINAETSTYLIYLVAKWTQFPYCKMPTLLSAINNLPEIRRT